MDFFRQEAFISEIYTNNKIQSLLKSSFDTDKILGLRYILCRIQEGYEFLSEFDDIIKLVDTTNVTLKKLTNEYLRYYFKNQKDEDKKLLLVNTFLKDFADMSDCIINYILEFSNESIIRSYLPYIIKYVQNASDKKEAYQLAHACDKKFGTDILKQIKEDWENSDFLNAISFSDIRMPDNILVSNIYDNEKLIPILRKFYYEGSELSNENILKILLKKDDIQIFYYTCKIIVTKYPDFLQEAYEQSLNFLDIEPESLYHILLLHEDLIKMVSYSNKSYMIYSKDPDYIKIQKIRLLFHNLDDISINEIKQYNYLEIIKCSIVKNCNLFEDVFYENSIDFVIDLLYKTCSGAELSHVIQKYLLSIKKTSSDMKIDILKKYVQLCSLYFDKDELLQITASFNTILSYYLNLYRRQIISKNELIENLENYKVEYRDKIKVVINLIKTDISSLLQFKDVINVEKEHRIRYDLYSNLLNCKPYGDNKEDLLDLDKLKINSPDLKIKKKTNVAQNIPIIKRHVFYRRNELKEKVFIDHDSIKGILTVESSSLVLCIDIIEQDTVVKCTTNSDSFQIALSKESKIPLCDIGNVTDVKLEFCGVTYEIVIRNKISKNKVSEKEWENEFNRLSKYKLVSQINLDDMYKIDDDKFSFLYYDEEVYGRIYNGQIILKGPESVLKDFN